MRAKMSDRVHTCISSHTKTRKYSNYNHTRTHPMDNLIAQMSITTVIEGRGEGGVGKRNVHVTTTET